MFEVPAVRILVISLAVCGLCPLSAVSKRIPRWLDVCNALLRIICAVAYSCLNLMAKSLVNDLQGKTFQVSLISVRCMLVVYQIVALPMLPAFGQCVSKIIRIRLRATFQLALFGVYTATVVFFGALWRNPFQSWGSVSSIFPYVVLTGNFAVASLLSVLLQKFRQQLVKINKELEQPPKSAIELEYLLAWAAGRRAKLNESMADVEKGLGPMVAATIVTICLRLSFMAFANFSAAMEVLSGKSTSLASVTSISVRLILKMVILSQLAHCGQQLVEEDSKSKIYLDRIVTKDHNLPVAVTYQIGKCWQVFNYGKSTINAWGFFNLDHTLILTVVNIMFSLVLIQVQFYVSEAISAR